MSALDHANELYVVVGGEAQGVLCWSGSSHVPPSHEVGNAMHLISIIMMTCAGTTLKHAPLAARVPLAAAAAPKTRPPKNTHPQKSLPLPCVAVPA